VSRSGVLLRAWLPIHARPARDATPKALTSSAAVPDHQNPGSLSVAEGVRLLALQDPRSVAEYRGRGSSPKLGAVSIACQEDRAARPSNNDRALRFYEFRGFVEEGPLGQRVRLQNADFVDDVARAWFPEQAAIGVDTQ
jgi:hypothetical protein